MFQVSQERTWVPWSPYRALSCNAGIAILLSHHSSQVIVAGKKREVQSLSGELYSANNIASVMCILSGLWSFCHFFKALPRFSLFLVLSQQESIKKFSFVKWAQHLSKMETYHLFIGLTNSYTHTHLSILWGCGRASFFSLLPSVSAPPLIKSHISVLT